MYSKQMKNDYTLFDAFQTLGTHLYGKEWTGNEYQGERVEDVSSTFKQRDELQKEIDEIYSKINAKRYEQKEVIGKQKLFQVNCDIKKLKDDQNDLFMKFNSLPDVHNSDTRDFGNWERFQYTEGLLLKGLRNNEISVYCLSGRIVDQDLWEDFPEDFYYDIELSLIRWPSSKSPKKVFSARFTPSKQTLFGGG